MHCTALRCRGKGGGRRKERVTVEEERMTVEEEMMTVEEERMTVEEERMTVEGEREEVARLGEEAVRERERPRTSCGLPGPAGTGRQSSTGYRSAIMV